MATAQQRDAFFATYAPYAQATQAATGVPASVTLAQAAVESGYGLSGLAQKALNFFGIKADKSWTGETYYASTQEEVNGKYQTEVAGFRAYDSPIDSFVDHAAFLRQNSRYSGAFTASNPYDFAQAVADAGYATSSTYADTIKDVMKANNLTQYDLPFNQSSTGAVNYNNTAQLASWKSDLGKVFSGENWNRTWDTIKNWDFFHGSLGDQFPDGSLGEQLGNGVDKLNGQVTDALGLNKLWSNFTDWSKTAGKYIMIGIIILLLLVFIGFVSVKAIGTEAGKGIE